MTQSTSEKKKEKQLQLQDLIFDTTTQLMKRYSFDEITIRMICAEAGLSTGMFYRNFERKSDILSYFYKKALNEYRASTTLTKQDPKNYREQLIQCYLWLVSYASSFGTDFIKDFYTPTNNAIKADSGQNEIAALSNEILDEAIRNGQYQLPDGRDTIHITHDFLIIIKGLLLDWYVNDGNYNIEEYAKNYLCRVMDSILMEQ